MLINVLYLIWSKDHWQPWNEVGSLNQKLLDPDLKQCSMVNRFPIIGSWVQNHWWGPRLNQPFIVPRSMKWVPGTLWDLVVKSKLCLHGGSVALRQVNPIHNFFFFWGTNLLCLLWIWHIVRNIANAFKKLYKNEIICKRFITNLLKI